MNRLNTKIVEILKQHPEGEDFFDALDAMVRGDMSILNTFLMFVESNIEPKTKTLVLTGQFGVALMNLCVERLQKLFSDIILVNGGIRTGAEPIIFREKIINPHCVMLDDSFYSGTTRNNIEKALKAIHSGASIDTTFVVYDGSKAVRHDVKSMFRYHSEKPLWENDLVDK